MKNNAKLTATELIRMRRHIRLTGSLIAGGKVLERPGENWAADLGTRTIFWRPSNPWKPSEVVTKTQLEMLTAHESFHLLWTGGFDTPEYANAQMFHRMWNAVEDLRIERIGAREFPGWVRKANRVNREAVEFHSRGVKEYKLFDQVWLKWMSLEVGITSFPCSAEARDFATETWPSISRIANSDSSEAVARGIEPVYFELLEAQKEKREINAGNLPYSFEGENGNDTLVEDPIKTPLYSETQLERLKQWHEEMARMKAQRKRATTPRPKADRAHLMDIEELLEAMCRESQFEGNVTPELQRMLQELQFDSMNDMTATTKIENPQQPLEGAAPRNLSHNNVAWDSAKMTVRPLINTLARKWTTTLRQNAQDDWEPNLRRGQLDSSQAFRSMQGNMNIYRDRHSLGAVDYTFWVTVDVSSSQRSRARELLRGVVLIVESLERAGLKVGLQTWNTTPGIVKMPYDSIEQFRGIIGSTIDRPYGNTYEAPALLTAYDALEKVKGDRVLITLTDGKTQGRAESQDVLEALKDMGVSCLGVGIGLGIKLEDMGHYEHAMHVDSADELLVQLPKFVDTRIRRG
jgi:hypothetical protein